MTMRINLPTQITLGRLVLAMVFFVLLAQFNVREPKVWLLDACIALFIIAAGTDWLDGYLARRRNEVTAFGRVLDPFVDKVLVCGTFVFLAGSGFVDTDGRLATGFQPWMAVLVLGRELLVTGLRGFSESHGIALGANAYGKAKMVLQSVTAPVVMFVVAHGNSLPGERFWSVTGITLVWLTVAVTTLSMLPYLFRSRDVLADATS